jgi:hypothetical protein
MSKQTRQAILNHVHEHGEISTATANSLFAKFYYYNGRKHVQDCLSRLVNSGELYRPERGLYKKGRDYVVFETFHFSYSIKYSMYSCYNSGSGGNQSYINELVDWRKKGEKNIKFGLTQIIGLY